MKPSPIASILLFVGALFLLIASFSGSWSSFSFGEDGSGSFGLLWGRSCFHGECHTQTIFSGGLGPGTIISVLLFLLCLGGAAMAGIGGLMLLKPGRSVLALIALILCSVGLLFVVVRMLVFGGFGSFGYAFYLFVLGALVSIAGSIMAMTRPRAAAPMGMRPGMPMGMHPGMYQQAAGPGYYPPQQGYQQPQQPQYQQPIQQAPIQPAQTQQGAPCPTCATPTIWVAQYSRWFCQRCNSYP